VPSDAPPENAADRGDEAEATDAEIDRLEAADHWGVEDMRSALGLLMLGRMLYSVPLPGSKSSQIGFALTSPGKGQMITA